jgi:hypothetical protein
VNSEEQRRQRVLQHHDPEVRRAGDQEGARHRLEARALPEQRVELAGTVLKPAGLEASKDSITALYMKEVTDPQWKNDKGFTDWVAFMKKYYPEARSTISRTPSATTSPS